VLRIAVVQGKQRDWNKVSNDLTENELHKRWIPIQRRVVSLMYEMWNMTMTKSLSIATMN